MIDANFRSHLATTRSGFSSAQASSSSGDRFTQGGDTSGVFLGKPVTEPTSQDPKQPKRVSANKLQSGLGLSKQQAQTLSEAANVDFQEPYRAGRLDTGEVFLITSQNYKLDPKGYTSLGHTFRVYVMDGQSNEVKELPVQSACRMPDGGSTYIHTPAGNFDFPWRNETRVCGRPLTTRLDSLQMS
ncbi:MAG: hypothetical protein U0931_23085 [Vulcanimicrobiota bacterium]